MSEATKATTSAAASWSMLHIEKERRQTALVSAARTRRPTVMQP